MKTSDRKGFTLIELAVVVCIIAFLSTIAVTVYRRVESSKYDSEALAVVEELYAQTLRLINDHGVSSENSTEIHTGCVILTRNDSTGEWTQTKKDNANFELNTKLAESGSTHWSYRVCIGFADAEQKSESFVVSAHNLSSERTVIAGAGLETPVTFASAPGSLPTELTLYPATVATAWKNK